MNLYNLSVTV